MEEHNLNWPQILDHTYSILILGGSGSGKTNALLNLTKQQNYDDYNIIDNIIDTIIDDKIGYEKLQYDINREATKISALSSSKIDKYGYLTGDEILPLCQSRMIEQVTFSCSPSRKTLEKTIEDQGRKQVEALKVLKPIKQKLSIKDVILEDRLNEETKNETE